mmetsp:Transcript_60569/g.174746  ORF Transcript_60569/g.174746 Transcript_60569/m.174746 type:complete len:232 (+) Transcript_60569:206-901(+)
MGHSQIAVEELPGQGGQGRAVAKEAAEQRLEALSRRRVHGNGGCAISAPLCRRAEHLGVEDGHMVEQHAHQLEELPRRAVRDHPHGIGGMQLHHRVRVAPHEVQQRLLDLSLDAAEGFTGGDASAAQCLQDDDHARVDAWGAGGVRELCGRPLQQALLDDLQEAGLVLHEQQEVPQACPCMLRHVRENLVVRRGSLALRGGRYIHDVEHRLRDREEACAVGDAQRLGDLNR